jgi:hypothetical protein
MSLSNNLEANALSSASEAVEDRLQLMAEMLVYGASRQEISDLAQKQWGVSRRTAQDYLHTVQQRLAGEAAEQDQLVALRQSQLQPDTGTTISRVNLRPPLPAGVTGTDSDQGGRDPNCRTDQKIELERGGSGAMATACAFCAAGP